MPPVTIDSRDALFGAMLELVPDPLWCLDAQGSLTSFNGAFARWWPAVAGVAPRLGLALDNLAPLREAQRRSLAGRSVISDFRRVIGGTERMYAIHAQPLLHDGAVAGAAFIAREIDERALPAEAAIELSLTNLFDQVDEPLSLVLPRVVELLGRMEGADAAVLWNVAGDGRHLRPEAMWFADGEVGAKLQPRMEMLEFEFGHGVPGRVWASRDVFWIPDVMEESLMLRGEMLASSGLPCVVGAPLTDSAEVTGVLEFFTRAVQPISERRKRSLVRTGVALGRLIARRRAEDERRWLMAQVERKGAEWMLTFDAIEQPIFLVTEEGILARVNRAARDFAGAAYEDLIGQDLRRLGRREPWITLAEVAQTVRDSGMACTAQIRNEESTWDVSASLLAADEGDDLRVVIVLSDLTQILSLQDAVRRGEQLAALGELVAGVAHEVKNPIFGMSMTLELLRDRIQDNRDAAELLGALQKWLQRLDGLTENLLEYGRTWSINLTPGNPDAALRNALESCGPRAAEAGVTVDYDYGEGAVILMDANRLVHVFENLITNAIHFSPAGGRVTIEAALLEDAVEYAVRDHGPGFVEGDLPRVFQPFFTRRRGGTGLGLAIVQRIMDEHGGTLAAGNHEGGGAVVHVRFPLYTGPK